MGIVSNTFTRYDAKGLREQLSDVIYNISPTETPVVSMAAKRRATQTLFEWQTDSLASAVTTNQQLEGDDHTSFPSVSPSVRVGNYTQISHKLLILSGTLQAVDKAGRKNELAYQMAKRGKEVKRDMEADVLSNQGGDAGGTSTARKTATLGAWVKTNVDKAGDGGNPAYTSGVPGAARTDGTTRAFTETILKSVMESAWTNGAEPSILSVGPYNKQVVSGFTGIVTRNYDISNQPARATAAIASIDVYVTDFGILRVVPNRYQRERDAWFFDPEFLAIFHLRPFHTEELAKTGDAHKRVLRVEWGLGVDNEAALGLAADLSTS